jgi:predicted MFS family arabinose efflux permease
MHATNPATMVFLPLLVVEKLNLSFSQVGIAILMLNLPHLLQFILGRWSDKNPGNIVLIGTIITGIFMLSVRQISSYQPLLIILFLIGIGLSMWNVSAWTLMSRIGEKNKIEGEVLGSYISLAKMGGLISFILSGFIVQKLGIPILFAINGIVILLGTAAAYTFILKNKAG